MNTDYIYAPKRFKAGGIHCGIKRRLKDLAVIFSEIPCAAAGVFTTNKFCAAPVQFTKKAVSDGRLQAVIINSGNANAFTGKEGMQDVLRTAAVYAEKLGIAVNDIAVASTGCIGRRLPVGKITRAAGRLLKSAGRDSFTDAAEAILTTDRHIKYVSREIRLAGKKGIITAIAKGAGMIYPDMATMLCFIVTDINISAAALKHILKRSAAKSFNCISVDGCRSTNDMVIAMANGASDGSAVSLKSPFLPVIQREFDSTACELAKMIVKDGEGAGKFIEIEVIGAVSFDSARRTAFAIANYNLLKCSFYGNTLSVGRIVAAAGAGREKMDAGNIDIYIDNTAVVRKNKIIKGRRGIVSRLLKRKEIKLKVNLNAGKKKAVVWTSDITPEYIRINMR